MFGLTIEKYFINTDIWTQIDLLKISNSEPKSLEPTYTGFLVANETEKECRDYSLDRLADCFIICIESNNYCWLH